VAIQSQLIMISLQNQIILITGASSGIGAACAKIFLGVRTSNAAQFWPLLPTNI
jgi:hypothetical protein